MKNLFFILIILLTYLPLESKELSRLIKLSKDYQDGRITESEFEKKKAEILK